jgi:hypothetical protein
MGEEQSRDDLRSNQVAIELRRTEDCRGTDSLHLRAILFFARGGTVAPPHRRTVAPGNCSGCACCEPGLPGASAARNLSA